MTEPNRPRPFIGAFVGVIAIAATAISGFNSITTEHVPEANDRTTIVKGFREFLHYGLDRLDCGFDPDQIMSAGDERGAAEELALAIRVGPTNTALHLQRGVALLHVGEHEAAATEFENGLRLDPTNPSLVSLLKQARDAERSH